MRAWIFAAAAALFFAPALAAEPPSYGPQLEGFDYPYPVERYRFSSQQRELEMAYIDVKPQKPNGETAVLLHGKNFCAATWEDTIPALVAAGYRVIAPDQIGFCKSSKPEGYQFTFPQLAANTRALLKSLGIERPILIGHSTGGMLALRYALTFPSDVRALALVDPIGLEDWAAKGVPWQSIDAWRAQELKTTAESLRAYEQATYYAGQWSPAYQRWVEMLAGPLSRPRQGDRGGERGAHRRHDLHRTGRARIFRHRRPRPAHHRRQGQYRDRQGAGAAGGAGQARRLSALGREAAQAIPKARLVEFPAFGPCAADPGPCGVQQTLIDELKAIVAPH